MLSRHASSWRLHKRHFTFSDIQGLLAVLQLNYLQVLNLKLQLEKAFSFYTHLNSVWKTFQTVSFFCWFCFRDHEPTSTFFKTASSIIFSVLCCIILLSPWWKSAGCHSQQSDLCLCEAQLCCQLSSLRQGKVLGRLESPLQHCQLVGGVDGPGLAYLLRFPINHPNLHVWLLFHCTGETKRKLFPCGHLLWKSCGTITVFFSNLIQHDTSCIRLVKQWSGSVCRVSTEQFVQMSSTKIAPATTTQSFKEIPPALWTYNFGLKVPQSGRKTEIYRSFSCSLEARLYTTLHICTVNLVFYLFTGSFKTHVHP